MKECLGGYYLVINSTTIVTCGRQLMDIGYKYNSRKVLGFIAIEGGGRTEPGDPHLYPLPDNYYIFLFDQFLFLTYLESLSISVMKYTIKNM